MEFQRDVDEIYETAVVPTRWPQLIEKISNVIGGGGGHLFAVRDGYLGAISSQSVADIYDRFIKEGWSAHDKRLPRAIALNHPGFVGDRDLLTAEELATDEVYEKFHRPNGIGYMASTVIPNPSGDVVAFAFQRHQRHGPVPFEVIEYLDLLRPHLARASMLSFRLGFERARAQAEAMQALGLPGAVLGGRGRITAANRLFEALMPATVQDRQQRVMLTDEVADRLLVLALEAIAISRSSAVSSIPIAALAEQLPMILHVIPVRGSANDLFSQARALLVVTPIDRATVPTAEVLQGLFDLTPAEARIARGIGQAHSIDTLAKQAGVDRETVRSQLRAVLSKTGLSRQQELVSLLAGKTITGA